MARRFAGSLSLAALALACGGAAPAAAQDSMDGGGLETATCTSPNRLVSGTTIRGRLDAADPRLDADDSAYELWCLPVRAGQVVRVAMTSPDFDPIVVAGRFDARDPQTCQDCASGVGSQGAEPAVASVRARRAEVLTVRPNTLLGGQSGAFTLTATVSEPVPPRVTPISFGQTLTGTIGADDWLDFETDPMSGMPGGHPTDLYAVRLTAGQLTEITLSARDDAFDPYLQLGRVTAGGTFEELMADDDSGPGLGSRIRFTPETSGTYLIRVRPLAPDGQGPYVLRVGGSTEPSRQSPVAIAPGATIRGTISDRTPQIESDGELVQAQEYVFLPRPDTTYIVTLESDAFDAFLEVGRYVDGEVPGFNVIASNDDIEPATVDDGQAQSATPALPGSPPVSVDLPDTNARVRFRPDATGPVIIRARSLDGTPGAFVLRLSTARIAPDPAAGTPLALGSTVPVVLADGGPRRDDRLYSAHAISLREGQRVEILLETRARDGAVDPFVMIGTGTPGAFEELRADDDGAGFPNARMVFTAPRDGSYTILAATLAAEQSGRMDLTVTEAAPLPAARPVQIGDTVSGEITGQLPFNDEGRRFVDYALTLEAGQTVRIRLDYTGPEEAENRIDPYLEIGSGTPASFAALRSNDDAPGDGTLNSLLRFQAPEAGTYIIRASALNPATTGPYRLRIEAAAPPPPPPPPTPIGVGDSVEGALTADDAVDPANDQFHDRYAFEGRAGERFVIELRSTDFDSFLSVRAAGEPASAAQTDDDSGGELNSRLEYEVRTSGQQVIRVAPLGDFPALGSYTLRLSRP